jgi:hypothetical protein
MIDKTASTISLFNGKSEMTKVLLSGVMETLSRNDHFFALLL